MPAPHHIAVLAALLAALSCTPPPLRDRRPLPPVAHPTVTQVLRLRLPRPAIGPEDLVAYRTTTRERTRITDPASGELA